MINGMIQPKHPDPRGEFSRMTYDEKVEQAIAANDIEALVKQAARAKVVPLPLFSGKIQRV